MNEELLIWSLILSVPMTAEYFIWSRSMRPLRRWRLALWTGLAAGGWAWSAGLGDLVGLLLIGLLLLAGHVAIIVVIVQQIDAVVMWLRSNLAKE